MGAQRSEVLRGVKAGAKRGGRGAQRGVGDRDLDGGDRGKDSRGVLGLDVAERAAATCAESLDKP